MQIAIVNSIREIGGGEKWLARVAGCWRQRGHAPLLYCRPGSGVERLAAEAGIETQPTPIPHDLSLPAAARLYRGFRARRPDVVLCCNERAFRVAAPAAHLARVPLVYRNGLTATFKNRRLNRLLFRRAAAMVVISEALRAEMAGYGWIPSDRIRIIRNGVDLAAYGPDPEARRRIREELGVPPDAAVAAVAARVTPDKGQEETIRAFAALARRLPSAELWIVGEGSTLPSLRKLAAALDVGARVRFPGFRTDMPALFQAVDVVVQASHREGLGNTLLEAMASGRPIVASAVGGILDVVLPGETGELVPPRDPARLAAALEPLLQDPELRARYGAAGRRRAEREFSLERELAEWDAFFEGLPRG